MLNKKGNNVVFNITVPGNEYEEKARIIEGSENGDDDDQSNDCCNCCKCSKCCTPCCNKLCLPCSSITFCKKMCCRNNPNNQSSSSSTSCWSKLKCCKGKSSSSDMNDESKIKKTTATTSSSSSSAQSPSQSTKERGKCRLCIDKFLCCKKTNKIDSRLNEIDDGGGGMDDGDEMETGKHCLCLPCRKNNRRTMNERRTNAWRQNEGNDQGRRESIISNRQPEKRGCLSMIGNKLLCCRRFKKNDSESRRTSMNSKKQSIAPTLPPEDTRPKLDMVLVEHGSMMKGAIPVLPLCLAWFCLICNCIVPGLGTILSGVLCICLGIPRFSQHDSARARIGSFVINCIVGVAQAFTLLFCLVGWGWSIWWGTIMLRTARKRKKIKDAEAASIQAEQAAAMANSQLQNHRDIEAGGGDGGGAAIISQPSAAVAGTKS